MSTKNRTTLAIILATSMLFLLSCGIGSFLSPTATPTLAPTATSTETPTTTATPLPIATATPAPSPTPQSFAIQNEKFQDYKQDCITDVNITSVEGDSIGIQVNTTITMLNGGWALFCYGAKHTWIGTLTYAGYTFASEEKDPLQFMVDENKGYVYIGGKGVITMPDGSVVNLGGGKAVGPTVPSSGDKTLFSDDFSTNINGWQTGEETTDSGKVKREILDGKYLMTLTATGQYFYAITFVPNFSGKDFLFSIGSKVIDSSASAGNMLLEFTLREADGVDGKRYSFSFFNDNSYYVDVWPSADYQSMKTLLSGNTGISMLKKGDNNTFSIQAKGSTFTFFVNGNEIDTFTDTTIDEAGSISLWLGLYVPDESLSIEFDNLALQEIP